jgi:hypothetical protein
MDLDERMEIDHVVQIMEDGSVIDRNDLYAPEINVDTDGEGSILAEHESDMIEDVKRQGWEMLTGWTGQYGYGGPIMHQSEYIGGRLSEHILSTPGIYCAVAVETYEEDSGDAAGWAVCKMIEQ